MKGHGRKLYVHCSNKFWRTLKGCKSCQNFLERYITPKTKRQKVKCRRRSYRDEYGFFTSRSHMETQRYDVCAGFVCDCHDNIIFTDKNKWYAHLDDIAKGELKEIRIQRNLYIIKSLNKRRHHRAILRRDAAVYRLYKNCGMHPNQIARETHLSQHVIKISIGRTFKRSCLADQECVVKKYFTEPRLTPN